MIPQTLLWVGLIVAWLVVLVPMLAARHPKVNQVSDATLKTRLLHRGGSAKLALRRKLRPTGPAAGVAESDDLDEINELDVDELPEGDEVLFSGREVRADADGAVAEADDFDAEAHAFVDSDVDELPVSSPMDGDTTPITTVRRADVTRPTPEPAPVIARTSAPEPEPEVEADEPAPEVEFAEAEAEPEVAEDLGAVDDEIPADEQLTEEVDPVVRSEVEYADYDDDVPRSRRGGFDPENDARLSEARFRFRQRVTLLLGVLAVVALGAGLMDVPFAWYGLGAVVVALVVYLTYLRRTVRIESEIRRRRMARLERARREREREAEVRDGIPAHMRRGGCVVMEIDDEDPAFDHLPRYRAAEFDFLRNSSEVRESLERKVG
ncbi:gephyrin-like molybdotransferase receptor GlpR [Tsukamurella sp. PLM1]|uniref:divisome protein SepX/GlpR n=1 Tax=Tsukamurella sp. PLM1 TaxID=2929795 RepID=UPI002066B666|nr:gephyrin-like molybdotransferase receptor GlpR [Tsukamurella sp. PLM1]BDH55979.1 hypothetical protein MTP03_09180 [Tsukamurella sp. PLM1]